MEFLARCLVLMHVFILTSLTNVSAQSIPNSSRGDDPNIVVTTYSTKMIEIMKGPIAKTLSFIILLACVAALLRGRHRLAISCGVGFIVLLFLQII